MQHWSIKFCGNHFKPQSIPLAPIYIARAAAFTSGINAVTLYQSAQVNRLDKVLSCDIHFNRFYRHPWIVMHSHHFTKKETKTVTQYTSRQNNSQIYSIFWISARSSTYKHSPVTALKHSGSHCEMQEKCRWSGGTGGEGEGRERERTRKKPQTSPFNFLKTFQHLFCTLTYANSKGPQWLGSHFRPSVEPESSSAVKWERRSAVWKWISLAEIRGALSEPCTPSMGKKNCCTNCFWYIKYLLLYFTDGKQ